jgi:TPR repeat protein
LDYCKSTKISPESCLLHCQWASFLREDLNDDESALEFYKFSANMGHIRSMHKLGVMTLFGHGTESNPRRAKYHFLKILNNGSDHIATSYYNCVCSLASQSSFVLHTQLASGPLPSNTTRDAINKMKQSIMKGLEYHLNSPWSEVLATDAEEIRTCMASAQLILGRHMLRKSQNVDEALKWLIESAKLGNHVAMCTIGDAFTFQTSGTVQNIPLARKYYALASSLGNKKAKRRIDSLADWE